MKRFISLFFVFAALSAQAQSIKMEFRPVKGVEYHVSMEISQVMTIIVPGMGNLVTQSDQIIGAVLTLAEQAEQAEQAELAELAEHAELAEQAEHAEQVEQVEQVAHAELAEQVEQVAQAELVEHAEQAELAAQAELAEQVEQVAQEYLVEVRLMRMSVKATGQGQSQVFDSEGEDIMSQAIKSMMGKPLQMTISRRGEVLEQMPVEDAFYKEADSILATQYARRRREQTLEQIKQVFSQNTIKSVVQAGLTRFPDREMTIPSVWTYEEPNEDLGAIVTVQQRLTGVLDNRASMTARSVIMPDPNAKKSNAPQRMERISGNGEIASVIDSESGWVIESNGSQSLRGDLVVEQGGQVQAMDVTIEVKIKITGN